MSPLERHRYSDFSVFLFFIGFGGLPIFPRSKPLPFFLYSCLLREKVLPGFFFMICRLHASIKSFQSWAQSLFCIPACNSIFLKNTPISVKARLKLIHPGVSLLFNAASLMALRVMQKTIILQISSLLKDSTFWQCHLPASISSLNSP